MAFLHCHSCDWSQDDFYSVDGYNPASSLKSWMKDLCSPGIDEQFAGGSLSRREVIAQEFEKYAERIRDMKWVTWEQWQKDRKMAVCPNCGAKDFDID